MMPTHLRLNRAIFEDVGFTGTRNGPSKRSTEAFRLFVLGIQPRVFRHGACRGWDSEAVEIIRELCPHCHIIAYPGYSSKDRKTGNRPNRCPRAIRHSNQVLDELPHLMRNEYIVRDCRVLIGCPPTEEEMPRGGTWFTIRHGREARKPTIIIPPNGYFQAFLHGYVPGAKKATPLPPKV